LEWSSPSHVSRNSSDEKIVNASAETNMFAIGFFLLVGLSFVGVLILGAALAARQETRKAGLWILGGAMSLVVILPLAWLLVGSDAGGTTFVTDANGRQVQVQRGAPTPMILMFIAIAVGLALLVGEIALLVNPRTRTTGLVLLVVGALAAIFVVPVRTYYGLGRPSAPVAIESGDRAVGTIPVDEAGTGTGRIERATPPAAPSAPEPAVEDAAADSAASPVAPVPPTNEAATAEAPPQTPPAEVAKTTPEAAAPSTSLSHIGGVTITTGDKSALPDWAKQGGGLKADGTYFVVTESGPHRSFHDCWQKLRSSVEQEVRNYGSRTGSGFRNRWPSVRLPEHLYEQLVAEHYLEKRDDFSFGEPMLTLYSRIEFTDNAVAAIGAWQTGLLAQNRTIFAGVIGGLIVALVGVVYGYFRIDTATLGYYTWRLRVAAGVLTIAVVIVGIVSGALFFEQEWRLGGIAF
jgi:hypothetical protein